MILVSSLLDIEQARWYGQPWNALIIGEIDMLHMSSSQHVPSSSYMQPSNLGDRLRCARREKGLTQSQLATLAGTNQSVIQKIENNRSLRPRKIDEIAAALGTSPSWLMFGSESQERRDAEALAVAKIWSELPEPFRSRIRAEIIQSTRRANDN